MIYENSMPHHMALKPIGAAVVWTRSGQGWWHELVTHSRFWWAKVPAFVRLLPT